MGVDSVEVGSVRGDSVGSNLILHLGLSSFHRTHQAFYLQKLHEMGFGDWVIAAGNIRPDFSQEIAALRSRGGVYTLKTIDFLGQEQLFQIRSIKKVIPYEEDLTELLKWGEDSRTKIISFTVTEAGYYLTSDDRIHEANEDIQADLLACSPKEAGKKARKTVYGALYAILKRRERLGSEGKVTLMSCDNLRDNGKRFKKAFRDFLQLLGDRSLLDWVESNCAFPSAMVDRITPRPNDKIIADIEQSLGWRDPNAIMAEDFIQWVLEDDFIAGRPPWEKVSVAMVEDVKPYEEAKIRLLNASHSCLAWAGALVGYQYIHESVANEAIREFAHNYMNNDVIPLLTPSPIDLQQYSAKVLERFSNRAILDTVERVAMDSFSKMPGFIVPTIEERLERGESIADVMVLPALLLVFLRHWHEGRIDFVYQDQAMDREFVKKVAEAHNNADNNAPNKDRTKEEIFCSSALLWGKLRSHPVVVKKLAEAVKKVQDFLIKQKEQREQMEGKERKR